MTRNVFTRTTRAGLGVAVVSLVVCAPHAWANDECEPETTLVMSDPAVGQMGRNVAMDGDWLATAAGQSTVFIFYKTADGWEQVQEISGHFDARVAIDGERMVIGNWATRTASVYELDGDQWIHTAELSASDEDTAGLSKFGKSVAISGDVIVVGAKEAYNSQGRAYIFEFDGNTWVQHPPLDPKDVEDGWAGNWFGQSVDVDDDLVIVGTNDHFGWQTINRGAVFVYRSDIGEWLFENKIFPTHEEGNPDFDGHGFNARVVAIDGNWIVTGAPTQSNNGGAAYVYHYGGDSWSYIEKLPTGGIGSGQRFGNSVAISGDVLSIGAPMNNPFQPPGRVYMYDLTPSGASEPTIITHGDSGDYFGESVAMSNGRLAVGSNGYGSPNTGAAYVISPVSAAMGTGPCDPEPEPEPECPADLTGSQSVGVDDLLIVLNAWGPCSGCTADLTGSQSVGVDDLLIVLNEWGACPE